MYIGFRTSTLVVPAEREILETRCPNYEILVVRACFQVSFTVFSFSFLLEVDFKTLAGLFSHAENIHVSWRRNLAYILSIFIDRLCGNSNRELALYSSLLKSLI